MSHPGNPSSNTDLPTEICDYIGLIRDEEILAATSKNLLLVNESMDPKRIRQASYELRLSQNVEFLILGEGQGAAIAKYERPANGIGETLRIDPGHTVKVFAIEIFNLPTNVVAHVFPVGNIYKLGLSPETTYADPGFEGQFYIILCNYSGRVVELRVGQPIARVEFVKLARSTKKPHPGAKNVTEPELWPKRVDRRSLETLRRVGVDELLNELDHRDPPHIEHAFVAREVKRQISEQQSALQQRVASLAREIARYRVVAYIALAATAVWLIKVGWHKLPPDMQAKITEKTLNWLLAGIGVGLTVFVKQVRRTLKLAFLGKDSQNNKS